MNRAEFMLRLADLLADVSDTEKEEAIQYYNDYFDDAGAENESSVLESLGSPEELAKSIKSGINDGGKSGEFTEAGYNGYEAPKQEIISADQRTENQTENGNGQNGSQTGNGFGTDGFANNRYNSTYNTGNQSGQSGEPGKKGLSGGMLALVIIAVVFSPVWIGIVGGLFGVLVGLCGAAFGILIAAVAVAVSLVVTAIALFIAGIIATISTPLAGLCMIGASMIVGALGILGTWAMVMLIGKVVPMVIKGIKNLFHKIFKKGGNRS